MQIDGRWQLQIPPVGPIQCAFAESSALANLDNGLELGGWQLLLEISARLDVCGLFIGGLLPVQVAHVDISPVNYHFSVYAMSNEMVPFALPMVFTVGPKDPERDGKAFVDYCQKLSTLSRECAPHARHLLLLSRFLAAACSQQQR